MLQQLRLWLQQQGLDGWLQNRSDEFLGEYVKAEDELLAALSGFYGSAGMALVLPTQAFLFVDGRYDLEAKSAVDHNYWQVVTAKDFAAIGVTNFIGFLQKKFSHKKIGFDAKLFADRAIAQYQQSLATEQIELVALTENPIRLLQANNYQPTNQTNNLPLMEHHPLNYSGMGMAEKIQKLQQLLLAQPITTDDLNKKNKTGENKINIHKIAKGNNYSETLPDLFLNDPYSICWLANIRGRDLAYNPILQCYGLVDFSKQTLHIFLNKAQWVPPNNANPTNREEKKNLIPHDFSELPEFLKNWRQQYNRGLAYCPADTNVATANLLRQFFNPDNSQTNLYAIANPIDSLKAIKTPTEIQGAKLAHVYDGIALCQFFYWLEQAFQQQSQPNLSELDLVEKLLSLRQQQPEFIMPSFETIAAVSSHAAMPHYRPNHSSNKKLNRQDILLLDSGGHYRMGTTDITRCLPITDAALATRMGQEFAYHYCLVLLGHLNLSQTRFPKGITGQQLDPLARFALWQEGLDFNHATGHGVGNFLSVHEGPQFIGKGGDVALSSGMITSNEPGYYLSGQYGIRIENLELCYQVGTNDLGIEILGFESLTVCPIDKRPIELGNNKKLFPEKFLQQLNHYHQKVYDAIAPYVTESVKTWLYEKTRPIH